jgi:predicted permease
MNESLTVLNAVLPVFGLAVAGWLLRKVKWLTAEADRSLTRLTINLLLPCLIIHSSLDNVALRDRGNLLLAPLVGFMTASGGMLLAYWLRGAAGVRNESEGRTFGVSVGLYNYGFIPIPLAILLHGSDTVGVLCLHNIGVEVAVWTTAILLLTGSSLRGVWRNLLTAPLVAMAIGLGLNWTDTGERLPVALQTVIGWLADCSIPMSLILAGATVADHLHEFHAAHGRKTVVWAVLIRLGLLPVGFLLLARWLPATHELKQVIVIQAAMTSAVFPVVLARHYGGDPATAVRAVVATSMVGLLTIPIWLQVGRWFVSS